MDAIMKKLVGMASAIDRNKYLRNIKDALLTILPLMIIGSFSSVIATFLKSDYVLNTPFTSLSSLFSAINFACVSCMTIILVVVMGYLMGKSNKIDPLQGAMVAFVSYLVLCPSFVTATIDGVTGPVNNVLGSSYLGAAGMMVALITAILSVQLLTRLNSIERIKIHMPAEVPPMISRSFNVLIPMTITVVIVAFVGWGTVQLSGQYLPDLFYSIIQQPLEGLAQTPAAAVLIVFITNLLWFLGIHGGMATRAVRSPFLMAGLAANIAAVQAGVTPDNFFTETFWQTFVVFGGTGYTLSLLVAIFLFSKREDYREIAKMGLIPNLFGVNEPVIYGMPIVLNPILGIPYILYQPICVAITMFATKYDLMSRSAMNQLGGVPQPIATWLACSGDLRVFLWFAVICVVCVAVWYPFLKVWDARCLKEELEAEQREAAEAAGEAEQATA